MTKTNGGDTMGKFVDVIRQAAPKCAQVYLDGFSNDGALTIAQITTPLRMAHLGAQIMGETGGGTVIQENMNYGAPRLLEIFGVGHHTAAITPNEAQAIQHQPQVIAERVYGLGNMLKARELGNTRPGDGWTFRGIGPLQSTGRGAAAKWGARCNADFQGNVLLMVDRQYIMQPPLLEWAAGQCNALADTNDVRRIRRIINGGYNGLADVEAWLDKLWPMFREPGQPEQHWQAGAADPITKWIQGAINVLGVANPKLMEDGLYGPATKAAVKAYQEIAHVTADGIAGPVTLESMRARLATRGEGARAAA